VVQERGIGSSENPAGTTRLGHVSYVTPFDRAEAAEFGQSIGATVVQAHTYKTMRCEVVMIAPFPVQTREPRSEMPPSESADLEFFGPERAEFISGFPPQWEARVRGTMNRRQIPNDTPVEVIDRSNQRTWLTESDRDSSRAGEMEWRAEDQPFRNRLPNFARWLGSDRVVFVGMWGPDQNADEVRRSVYVWFYRANIVRQPGS